MVLVHVTNEAQRSIEACADAAGVGGVVQRQLVVRSPDERRWCVTGPADALEIVQRGLEMAASVQATFGRLREASRLYGLAAELQEALRTQAQRAA